MFVPILYSVVDRIINNQCTDRSVLTTAGGNSGSAILRSCDMSCAEMLVSSAFRASFTMHMADIEDEIPSFPMVYRIYFITFVLF
jgi:hypothetical protein